MQKYVSGSCPSLKSSAVVRGNGWLCNNLVFFVALSQTDSSLLFAVWDKHMMQVCTYFYLKRKIAVSGAESLRNTEYAVKYEYSTVRFTV